MKGILNAHRLSDCSTSLTAMCSASLIFCSISLCSSLVLRAVASSLCLSCSVSAALCASSLASSSAIWAFSASRSAVSSERIYKERWKRGILKYKYTNTRTDNIPRSCGFVVMVLNGRSRGSATSE